MAHQQRDHDRSLTAAGLAGLLARLDADPDRAAGEYERLRRALLRFFDWRGVASPDECADHTLDRLALKLQTTVVEDVWSYAHGVARLVFFEQRRQPVFASIDETADRGLTTTMPLPDGPDERLRSCMDRCLAELDVESRSLLLAYYEGERSERIRSRRRLAERLGLSENALRSRLHRLRERLERCIEACAAQDKETT